MIRTASPKLVTEILRQVGTASRPEETIAAAPHSAPEDTEAELTVHALELKREARRTERKRVILRATLIGADGAQTVRVKDLTSDGAGLACQVAVESGTDVVLRRGDLFIAARVAWTNGMAAGLEFYRPVEPQELAAAFAPA